MNEFVATVNSKKRNIKVLNQQKIIVDGIEKEYSLIKISDHSYLIKIGSKVFDIAVTKINSEKFGFLIYGHYFETTVRTTLQEKANELLNVKISKNHHDILKAPMPGMVLKIRKHLGDSVEIGESILILEAMKMENDLRAPSSGTIKEIHVKEGNSVEKGEALLVIE